jgi:hypothetical protein
MHLVACQLHWSTYFFSQENLSSPCRNNASPSVPWLMQQYLVHELDHTSQISIAVPLGMRNGRVCYIQDQDNSLHHATESENPYTSATT